MQCLNDLFRYLQKIFPFYDALGNDDEFVPRNGQPYPVLAHSVQDDERFLSIVRRLARVRVCRLFALKTIQIEEENPNFFAATLRQCRLPSQVGSAAYKLRLVRFVRTSKFALRQFSASVHFLRMSVTQTELAQIVTGIEPHQVIRIPIRRLR